MVGILIQLFSVKESIKNFPWDLDGHVFIVFTDRKPSATTIEIQNPSWTPRQFPTFAFIAEFNCDIEYISGKLNHTTEILSRSINNITICPTFIEDQKKWDPNLLKFKIKPSFKNIAGTLLAGFGNVDSFRVAVSSPEFKTNFPNPSPIILEDVILLRQKLSCLSLQQIHFCSI
uniref:Uncharacterized protein n=1 Tax=Lepeophtheirus salmonis TaxID=72036 RepID=A0A0K2TBL4_LEPSM